MKINPQVLTWARETAGLSVEDAARQLGFADTRKRTAGERLQALESGAEEPTRSILQKMAERYRRSLLVFYLKEPPPTGDRGKDFRTVPGAQPPLYNPLLDALIRDIRKRQDIVRAVQEELEAPPVDFVGAASLNNTVEDLAKRITERLQFSLEEFRRQPKPNDAFAYLRRKIEASGAFVLLLGDLGSHHTKVSVDIFRGFAVADPVAPFIVINDQDARAAWSFTAFHELAHLWLGATGVSGDSVEARIERFCNDVAGEILLPTAEVTKMLAGLRRASLADAIEAVTAFANERNISRPMVAYKLFRAEVITETAWRKLADHFRDQWRKSQIKEEQTEASKKGGPNYYVVRRHRLGDALLDLVRGSLGEGILTPTKAGLVLGVKPRNVDPLLHGTTMEGGR